MKDDQMDELLIQGVRDYNEPGPVPREHMWARIDAERRARGGVVAGGSSTRRWGWAVTGIAAAAVLAAGIVIGRRLERASTPSRAPIVAQKPGQTPNSDSTPDRGASTPQVPIRDSLVAVIRGETGRTAKRVRELGERAAPGVDAPTESENLAYRLVVLRHLAGSEAMITAFRSSARSGEVDAQIGEWSRELLSTTRMLEASPVTQDPTMKRLLEDLDLVIAQIAQYVSTGRHNPDDLDLIEQSITKRGVITKLRSTIPTRPVGT
jgi:hypothetical protein